MKTCFVAATVLFSLSVFIQRGDAQRSSQNAELQRAVEQITAAHHGKVALFAEDLSTGQTVSVQPDAVVQTASVIKLTILYEALEQMREGRVHLDDRLTLRKSDQVPGSGVLLFFDTPLEITLKDALTMMVVISDNVATNLVIDHLGIDRIDARIRELGLRDTYLYKKVFEPAEGPMPADQKVYGLGKTTPREMARVMEKLVRCDLGEPGLAARREDAPFCGFAMHLLTNQFYQDGIPRDLATPGAPEGAIANKTGSLDAVRNDVGAVSTKGGVIVLSIFTYDNADRSWTADNEGELTIAKLAKTIVDSWSAGGLVRFPAPVVEQPQP